MAFNCRRIHVRAARYVVPGVGACTLKKITRKTQMSVSAGSSGPDACGANLPACMAAWRKIKRQCGAERAETREPSG